MKHELTKNEKKYNSRSKNKMTVIPNESEKEDKLNDRWKQQTNSMVDRWTTQVTYGTILILHYA